ncbi:MAG: response regulator transcription factor [Lachnospiraceae bacterium]|nr:response regulator transcription factor [Lachnospiraceae bacterium]
MIRIGICDDSATFLHQTKFMIDHWDDGPQDIATELFEDGDALLRSHADQPLDIILLDVVMPLLNGIETAREIREYDKTVKIVFLTSSVDFAVDSYTVRASNYLLKPVSPEKLFECLEELVSDIRKEVRCIVVRSTDAIHRVEMSTIEYIEAQNKHVLFVLSGGKTIESINPLYSFEDKLFPEDGFFKCHRSYIVNFYHIDTYFQKEIIMRSGQRVPISRRCQKEFETAYFSAIFGKAGDP